MIFAKTSKALARLNEMIREGRIRKIYWAVTEQTPDPASGRAAPLHPARRQNQPLESPRCAARRGPRSASALPDAGRRRRPLYARGRRAAHGPPPPDPGPAVADRMSDPRRPEIRCPAVESRRRHFTPFAQRGFRAPRAPRAGGGHGSRAAGRPSVGLVRAACSRRGSRCDEGARPARAPRRGGGRRTRARRDRYRHARVRGRRHGGRRGGHRVARIEDRAAADLRRRRGAS